MAVFSCPVVGRPNLGLTYSSRPRRRLGRSARGGSEPCRGDGRRPRRPRLRGCRGPGGRRSCLRRGAGVRGRVRYWPSARSALTAWGRAPGSSAGVTANGLSLAEGTRLVLIPRVSLGFRVLMIASGRGGSVLAANKPSEHCVTPCDYVWVVFALALTTESDPVAGRGSLVQVRRVRQVQQEIERTWNCRWECRGAPRPWQRYR